MFSWYIVTSLWVIPISAIDSYCVWGRYGSNSAINALYTKIPPQTSYKQSINGNASICQEVDTYSLYHEAILLGERIRSSTWKISKGDTVLASCDADSMDIPSCTGDWTVWNRMAGNVTIGEIDGSIFLLQGSCPELECDVIHVSNSSAPECNGIYYLPTSMANPPPNTYKKVGEPVWLYYVPYENRFRCGSSNPVVPCDHTKNNSEPGLYSHRITKLDLN